MTVVILTCFSDNEVYSVLRFTLIQFGKIPFSSGSSYMGRHLHPLSHFPNWCYMERFKNITARDAGHPRIFNGVSIWTINNMEKWVAE